MKPQLLTILICGLLLVPGQPSWARKWTDSSGKFSVEAELVEVKGDKVVLKKTDGKTVTLPVARLSETDQRHLQLLAQELTSEPLRPAPEVIAAWEKAGARFNPYSIESGDIQAFFFVRTPTEKINVLPSPEVPYGLHLCELRVTDERLKELAVLTELQTLNLGDNKVTDAGVQELRKALPKVRIRTR
jgi:hypothetical protein